jgi:tRNA A37 threonylcarbamoyladenosine biosynthesis protein TsaE
MIELYTNTHEETLALGESLGLLAPPSTVVALYGDLGAGKTVFAKGVGKGLGVSETVTSPTYLRTVYLSERRTRVGRFCDRAGPPKPVGGLACNPLTPPGRPI